MDRFKELLKALGFTDEVIADIEKEESDISQISATFLNDQSELYKQNHKPDDKAIKDAERDATIAAYNTMKGRLAKLPFIDISATDLKDMEANDVVTKIADAHSEALKTASKEGTEELRAKLDEMKNNVIEWQDKYESLEASSNEEIEKAKTDADNRVNDTLNKLYLKGLTSNKEVVEFDYDDKRELYEPLIEDFILDNYKIDRDTGGIQNKDGTRAQRPDGKSFYNSTVEAIQDFAKTKNMTKVSHGGDNKPGEKTVTVNGKEVEVDNTGVNFLAEKMGVEFKE